MIEKLRQLNYIIYNDLTNVVVILCNNKTRTFA